ncbi:hypothetical protein BH10BAC3_BH10BAC3_12040 [soil metagenome]
MATGYYYSIAYNNTKDHVAQFSYVYYSNCSEGKLKDKLDTYIVHNNFETGRTEGPFTTQEEAETMRTDAKSKWKESGYILGGDNNFFGDCNE